MKKLIRTLLLLITICIVCAQGASAFTVSSCSATPATGDLTPGSVVSVDCMLTFSPTGGVTFPGTERLKFYSQLEDPSWGYDIIIDDVPQASPTTRGGAYLYLYGWELEYPSSISVKMQVTLEGKAPTVATTSNITVFKINQLEASDFERTGAAFNYEISRIVINPADITSAISAYESDLANLKALIDTRSGEGVDVTEVLQKYNAAVTALNSAKSAGYDSAQTYLDQTSTNINEANSLLDIAWTQKVINNAKVVLDDVDSYITDFKENKSMGNDAQVLAIVAKRESAGSLFTTANDNFNAALYSSARAKAGDAFVKGMEAYNDSVALSAQVGAGGIMGIFSPILSNLYIILGVGLVIVLVVAGVMIYHKKTRWDELG